MVVTRFETFVQWLLPNAGKFGALVYASLMLAGGAVFCIMLGYLIAAFRHGLSEGFYSVATVIAGAIPDFLKLSVRRVFAIARLAIKESIRARVFVAFAVFLVILMYARWFLNPTERRPCQALHVVHDQFHQVLDVGVGSVYQRVQPANGH